LRTFRSPPSWFTASASLAGRRGVLEVNALDYIVQEAEAIAAILDGSDLITSDTVDRALELVRFIAEVEP
jgi:hypothetical protein